MYDPSAKSSGPSLNDCLHVGPKFNQKINELLFRFRSYPVALVADIEKVFLMISVNPKDHNVLRFLWVEDPFSEEVKLTMLCGIWGFLKPLPTKHHDKTLLIDLSFHKAQDCRSFVTVHLCG